MMSEDESGRYTGKLILEPSAGSQRMKTTLEFGFLDKDGRHWIVPPGTSVGGASIPRALRSSFNDWRQGKYREAIVLHDHYCAVRSTDWRTVHRMFYHAMLVSGVSLSTAKLVYAGVYFAGPRWKDRVVDPLQAGQPVRPLHTSPANILYALCRDPVALAVSEAIICDGRSAFEWITAEQSHGDNSEITLELDTLSEMLEEDDPSLSDIEIAIDYAVSLIPCGEGSARDLSVGRTALLD
jgi:hypothetical protein